MTARWYFCDAVVIGEGRRQWSQEGNAPLMHMDACPEETIITV
jgi:hypothetical protein